MIWNSGKKRTVAFSFQRLASRFGLVADSSLCRWVNAMSDEMYRLLLGAVFGLQIIVISFVPYLGYPVHAIMTAWLYSLYSFE